MLLKVSDYETKNDAVPYSAFSPAKENASPPENKNLSLIADENNGLKTTFEWDIPEVTNLSARLTYKWRILEKPSDHLVAEGIFDTPEPYYIEVSLTEGAVTHRYRDYEVQVGYAGAPTFIPLQKVGVRILRDRTNFWFEGFSSDLGWRTAKPEMRKDRGSYQAPQVETYEEECLKTIYNLMRSTVSYGSTPKVSYVKPSITCFGEFQNALKSTYSSEQVTSLNSISRLDLTSVLKIGSYSERLAALRYFQARQTTFGSDANPTFIADTYPDRVSWVNTAVSSISDTKLTRDVLLALWQKEGSMNINTDLSNPNNMTGYNPWPLAFSAAVTGPPATADDAKTIYIYGVAYICMGSDFLLKHSGGADNQPDLQDYAAARNHFIAQADAAGGVGIGNRILSNLTATSVSGGFSIGSNAAFYEDMLILVGRHLLSVWQPEGPDVTYFAYNMGTTKLLAMRNSFSNPNYLERPRLGILDWGIHYEIRKDEWDEPRDKAHKYHCYRLAFKAKFP